MAPLRTPVGSNGQPRTAADRVLVVSDTPMTVQEHVGGQLTSVVAQKWSGCIVRVVGEARIPAVWLYSLYSNHCILYSLIHAPHPSTCPSQRLYSSTTLYSALQLYSSTSLYTIHPSTIPLSLRGLKGGRKKRAFGSLDVIRFDDCQTNEMGFGHIVFDVFDFFEGSQFNCFAIGYDDGG